MTIRLHWAHGQTAHLDLQSPRPDEPCRVKYTSAFRAPLRHPFREQYLSAADLAAFDTRLDALARSFEQARESGQVPPSPRTPFSEETLKDIGLELFTLMLPREAMSELSGDVPLYLELGVDEPLLAYPWELMCDELGFIALKHRLGRFVNLAQVPAGLAEPIQRPPMNALSILVVGVPAPVERDGERFQPLPAARTEIDNIRALFDGMAGVELHALCDEAATCDAVKALMLRKRFQIFHFSGHARFDARRERGNSLVLHDGELSTNWIGGTFRAKPPLLCFVNACDTARVVPTPELFSAYGLARAFLATGSYLLGPRWRVPDVGAATFARTFYKKLLEENASLGEAVRQARVATKATVADLSWASYVLYGDPRLSLVRDKV